jgi:hypothetical protein
VADSVTVDDRVTADHRRDQQSERNSVPALRAADEQHPGRDNEDSDRLRRRDGGADNRNRDHERGNRRGAAGDGVDDRELEAPVRGGEQRDVRELEQP